jgi:Histidine kinase
MAGRGVRSAHGSASQVAFGRPTRGHRRDLARAAVRAELVHPASRPLARDHAQGRSLRSSADVGGDPSTRGRSREATNGDGSHVRERAGRDRTRISHWSGARSAADRIGGLPPSSGSAGRRSPSGWLRAWGSSPPVSSAVRTRALGLWPPTSLSWCSWSWLESGSGFSASTRKRWNRGRMSWSSCATSRRGRQSHGSAYASRAVVGHALAAITLHAQVARRRLAGDPELVAEPLEEIIGLSSEALAQTR